MRHLIVKNKVGHDTWILSRNLKKLAGPVARKLGISLIEFLTRVSNSEYVRERKQLDQDEPAPVGFTITLPADEQLREWIERGARVAGKSVTDLAWEALASHVDCIEEGMIFDNGGNCILDHYDELYPFRKRTFHNSAPETGR